MSTSATCPACARPYPPQYARAPRLRVQREHHAASGAAPSSGRQAWVSHQRAVRLTCTARAKSAGSVSASGVSPEIRRAMQHPVEPARIPSADALGHLRVVVGRAPSRSSGYNVESPPSPAMAACRRLSFGTRRQQHQLRARLRARARSRVAEPAVRADDQHHAPFERARFPRRRPRRRSCLLRFPIIRASSPVRTVPW